MWQIRRGSSKGFDGILGRFLAVILFAALCSPALAISLINGDKVSDAILTPGDQDTFTFTAAVGDHVVLRIADTSNSSFFPRIELSGPSGGDVAAGSGQNVGTIEHDISEAGEYTVLVRDDSSSGANDFQTGTYDLYFVRAPDANELGELANGSVNAETINLGDLDTYTFSANAGDHVVLRVADTSGTNFFPRIELYGPSGANVDAGHGQNVGTVEHDATATGTFTVLIKDNQSAGGADAGVGNYNLYFVRTPGANELGELANDSVNAETIDSGDLDTYTFSANAGDHVVLRVADTSGTNFFPRIELYGPSGANVGAGHGQNVGTVEHDATATGTFTVLIKDNQSAGGNDAGVGNYNLYFVRTPGANELGELANDSVNAETIDLGDLDTYTFSANAGDHVVLRIADTSGTNFFPRVELYDPSGANVDAGHGQNVGTVERDATVTGTFTALIKDNQSAGGADAGVGNYNLYFVRIPSANELGLLVDGVDRTETIGLGDLDTYVFDAAVGTDITLEIEDLSGTNFFPRVELYGPNGAIIGAASGQNIGSTSVQTTQSGTHTVLVKDNQSAGGNDAGNGEYVLRFSTDGGSIGIETYPVGIRPPTELNLDNMDIAAGKFILTQVIGYSASNLGAELLMAPIEIDATIGTDTFHALLDVPSDVEVLNLIGRFEATSPAKPPVQFDYIMGPIDTTGPAANTISLPLFTDDFFYQVTDLDNDNGEDIFIDGGDPKPEVSLTPLAQSLVIVTGTNTWHIGYPSQITRRTPRPGQPHGTLGTPSTVNNSPVNRNDAPVVEDTVVTIALGETVTHMFIGDEPEGDSLTWSFIDITGSSVNLQPTFDPDTQLLTWDTTGSAAPGTFVIRVSAVDPGNQGDIGSLTVTVTDESVDTYTIGISPPAELDLDGMDIFEGTFNLTRVIGYSESNPGGVELLSTPVEVAAMIGSGMFHALLDVPSNVEVLNLIGVFEATSPVKPPARFDYIMGPIDTAGPGANTISLPLFTDDFFYQVTDLDNGEDVFVDGGDPKPDVSLSPLTQSLAILTGTNTWHIGYPSQISLGTPRPGQPHGTLGTSSSVSDPPVNLNNRPVVEDAAVTVTLGEMVTHTFTGVDPDNDSLTWRFIDITGSSVDLQPIFDPDTQLLTWDTTGSAAPGTFLIRVSAVDPGNQGDVGTLTVNVIAAGLLVLPDVVGLDQAAAEGAIVSAGLTVGGVTTANSDSVPAGSVISQNPPAGAAAAANSPVDIVVSLGPDLLLCDIDGNGTVDRSDIGLIFAARNQPTNPGDPRDNDGDGLITVADARQCVLLCTNPNCGP